jgi:hypothetical protein
MRILDQNGQELTNPDLSKGHLETETIVIAHHEAVPASPGVSHIKVIKTYDNGGKDVMRVWDEKPQAAKEAYDETETIQRYIPYTELELAQMGVEADRAEKAALIPTREELSGAIVEMATMAADNEGALAELAEYAAGLETRIAELEAKQ